MFSGIRYNLFLSNEASINKDIISSNNIEVIMNVARDAKDFYIADIHVACVFDDDYESAKGMAPKAARMLIHLLRNNYVVLVHCKGGHSRSSHVVALALSVLEDKNYEKAYREVRRLHTIALPLEMSRLFR